MAKYDAILFDVDGTLLDSADGIIQTLKETLTFMGISYEGIDLYKWIGPPLRQSFGQFFELDQQVEEAISHYRKTYRAKGMQKCTIYSGVHEMLSHLKAEGIPLHIVTNKRTQVIETLLIDQDLNTYFDTITGATFDKTKDTTADIIEYVIRSKGLYHKKILVVGDRDDDMNAAKYNHLLAAGVLYGYGTKKELEKYNPVFLANSVESLEKFILS